MGKKITEERLKPFLEEVSEIGAKYGLTTDESTNILSDFVERKIVSLKKKLSDNLQPRMMEAYNQFCIKKIGLKAKVGAAEGKAMKSIISYLKSNVKNKTNLDDDVVRAWEYILFNVDKWDNFHQSQLKIVQIDSNLPNILNAIRNGSRQQQATKAKSINDQYEAVINSDAWERRRQASISNSDAGQHSQAK